MKPADGGNHRLRIIRSPLVIGPILVVTIFSVAYIIFVGTVGIGWGEREGNLSPNEDYHRWSDTHWYAPQSLEPQWIPAGSRIVFKKPYDSEDRWPDDLYSITSDGSSLRKVADDARWLNISPDGSSIAYSTTREHQKLPYYIETSKPDGSGRRPITEQALKDYIPVEEALLNDVSPSWSPDGERIAFARISHSSREEGRGIYIMNADGTNQHRIFRFEGRGLHATYAVSSKQPQIFRSGETPSDDRLHDYVWGPVWSPDGGKLAFVLWEYEAGGGESVNPYALYESVNPYVLYVINADGSGLVRAFEATQDKPITPVDRSIDEIPGPPIWSPDGRKLAFTPFYYEASFAEEEITVLHGVVVNTINADGSGLQAAAEFDGSFVNNLSWSPNGKNILFTTLTRTVYIGDGDGSGVYSRVSDGSYAAWSPDGSKIAVIDFVSDEYLFTVNADGSGRQVLVRREEDGDLKAANR